MYRFKIQNWWFFKKKKILGLIDTSGSRIYSGFDWVSDSLQKLSVISKTADCVDIYGFGMKVHKMSDKASYGSGTDFSVILRALPSLMLESGISYDTIVLYTDGMDSLGVKELKKSLYKEFGITLFVFIDKQTEYHPVLGRMFKRTVI
jgi:uncharacterized protein with von Willebrand factor type A (vWA) domain